MDPLPLLPASQPQPTPCPALPSEILWEIAKYAWHSSLSPSERITLFTSSLLVNSHWMSAFAQIAFTDVHVLSKPFLNYYIGLFHRDSIIFRYTGFDDPVNDLCRSITFTITNDSVYPHPDSSFEPEMGKVLSDFLYNLKILRDVLPHLCALHIRYDNVGFDDIFYWHRFIDFPEQVDQLCLEYNFHPLMPRWLLEAIASKHIRLSFSTWVLPSVRYLSITGGCENLAANAVSACPNLEVLEVDSFFMDYSCDPRDEQVKYRFRVNRDASCGVHGDEVNWCFDGDLKPDVVVIPQGMDQDENGFYNFSVWFQHESIPT